MTTTREQVWATGLVNFEALVDHTIKHGLTAPNTIEFTDRAIRVWITEGQEARGESIHIDTVDTHPARTWRDQCAVAAMSSRIYR